MSAEEPFVMVPVPAEHVVEFRELVMRMIVRDASNRWSPEDIERLVDRLDDDQLAALDHLAVVWASGRLATVPELVEELGLGDQTLPVILAVNALAAELGLPVLVLVDDTVEDSVVGLAPVPAQILHERRATSSAAANEG